MSDNLVGVYFKSSYEYGFLKLSILVNLGRILKVKIFLVLSLNKSRADAWKATCEQEYTFKSLHLQVGNFRK